MLKALAKLILALNGNVSKSQLAAGFAWGVLLGIVPIGNFFWIVLFLVSFFFTHNHGSKIFSMAILKLLSPAIVMGIDAVGWQVLHIEALSPLFTTMFNMPFVPYTKFNNTLVVGGIVSGVVLWLPIFFLFTALIPLYRNNVAPKIRDSKIVRTIAKFPLFALIDKAVSGE
jgi:uncharacterized protein (TIGR03546 family)